MAEGNDNNPTFKQPKIGDKKPLPKGQGESKTNSQVFGIIGQQVMRINKLTTAIVQGNDNVVDAISLTNELNKGQVKLLGDVNKGLDTIATSLVPLNKVAEEILEGGTDQASSGTSKASMFGKLFDDLGISKQDENSLDNFEKKLARLEETLQRTGGGGGKGGFIGGAAFGGGIGALGGRAAGGAAGGALGGAVGGSLGAVGLGLAVLTGALYLGAAAVDKFGIGLQNTAKGLDDLNKVKVSTENFEKLNTAIRALVKDVGVKDSIAFRIFSGAMFQDLADGLRDLNTVSLNNEVFEDIGEAIKLISENSSILGSIGLRILSGTAFKELAEGMEELNQADVSEENLRKFGKGLGAFAEESNPFWTNFGAIGTANMIKSIASADFQNLADGMNALNNIQQVSPNLEENLTKSGQALAAFILTLTEDELFDSPYKDGSKIIKTLGERNSLKNLADGIKQLNTIKDGEQTKMHLTLIGQGLAELLAGTDNFFGTRGMKRLDDVDFSHITEGLQSLQSVASTMVEYTGPDGTSKMVRNSEIMEQDFKLVAEAIEGITSSVGYIESLAMQNLAVSRGGLFGEDVNPLKEIGLGLAEINRIPDFDPEKFKDIADALYFLVTGSRGETLLQEFDKLGLDGDDDKFAMYMATANKNMQTFVSIFTGGSLTQVAKALQELGPGMATFADVPEDVTENFAKAMDAMKPLVENLSDENISGTGNFKKLDKFIKSINKIDTDKMVNLSEVADALGVSVRGQPISQAQVESLQKSVIQQLVASNLIDSSQVNQINTVTPTYSTSYNSSGPSIIAPATIVTK